MSQEFVPFDDVLNRVKRLFQDHGGPPDGVESVFLVRDLLGTIHISVSDSVEHDDQIQDALQSLAIELRSILGTRGNSSDSPLLFVDDEVLEDLIDGAWNIYPRVYLADRLVTGQEWWTVRDSERSRGNASRYTLFSVKGGVGRSTTAAILAWHLANHGEYVMVVDLDLESPGLASTMLEPTSRPQYGVTDWFVEDLIGQGYEVIEWMVGTPRWAQNLEGDVRVVPAHGREPGEYLAKLGRVYMDLGERWTERLERMLMDLEEKYRPTVVLLESRSGLHDIAASAVTDLGAHVFLFATDSESTWADYSILFQHWQRLGLATKIRENLSVVSALTPFVETGRYLSAFRENAWDLFREYQYDALDPLGSCLDHFSFDLDDADAPHMPLVIRWVNELAAGASLIGFDLDSVFSAYEDFFDRFDRLHNDNKAGF